MEGTGLVSPPLAGMQPQQVAEGAGHGLAPSPPFSSLLYSFDNLCRLHFRVFFPSSSVNFISQALDASVGFQPESGGAGPVPHAPQPLPKAAPGRGSKEMCVLLSGSPWRALPWMQEPGAQPQDSQEGASSLSKPHWGDFMGPTWSPWTQDPMHPSGPVLRPEYWGSRPTEGSLAIVTLAADL